MINYLNYAELYFRRRKRLLLPLFLFALFLLYQLISLFSWAWRSSPLLISSNARCVEQYLNGYYEHEPQFDYIVWREYGNEDALKSYLPYVGNGKLGIALAGEEQSIFVQGKRSLDQRLPFQPLISLDVDEMSGYERASSIHIKEGIARRITCANLGRQSFKVMDTIYAHRTIASLLVQEIDIVNESRKPLMITFRRPGWSGKEDVNEQSVSITGVGSIEYSVISGQLVTDQSKRMHFAIASPAIPNFVQVKGSGRVHLVFHTLVNYTISNNNADIASLSKQVQESAKKVLSLVVKTKLKETHVNSWKNLWSSGFGISESKVPEALNGDRINSTIYYILSQKPISENAHIDIYSQEELRQAQLKNKLLFDTASCYDGHSTLQAKSLWAPLHTLHNVNEVISVWLLTLDKQGCHGLVAGGAESTMQALILSMAAMEFTKHHVEFNTHPKQLHRDYFIRRLRYAKNAYLNVTVRLSNLDNRASIYVAIDRNDDHVSHFYACDAGCLDSPVQLNTLYSSFPVKLTDPLTSILYITSDYAHISELKHTIHVHEVALAPAHEDHIIAMHKHGHRVSTIAALFWLIVILLIVAFHIFLARLVYNEYFVSSANGGVAYDRLKTVVE